MTQEQLIIQLFKGVLVADELAVLLFIAVYSVLSPWWLDPIGRTVVLLDALIGVALLPSVLSLFWHFNRLTSLVSAWCDVSAFAAIALVLLLRIPLWIRTHRQLLAEERTQEVPGEQQSA